MDLLQVEARILLEPLVAFFDIWNKHTVVSTADRIFFGLFTDSRMQLDLVNNLIEGFIITVVLIRFTASLLAADITA